MGDGQHVWAAAEWVMMMRNLFVREEPGKLVIGPGLNPGWLQQGCVKFGPTATQFGTLTIELNNCDGETTLTIAPRWHREPPRLEVAIPGRRVIERGPNSYVLAAEEPLLAV